jgi:hypothetical protein
MIKDNYLDYSLTDYVTPQQQQQRHQQQQFDKNTSSFVYQQGKGFFF